MTDDDRALRGRPTLRPGSRLLRAVVGLVVVVVAFVWVLPGISPYSQVWAALRSIGPTIGAAVAVVGAANLIAPAASQKAALPGLRLGDAVLTDWTTSAITNVIPAGSALAIATTWSMYRSFGLGDGPIARSIVVTGVWDTVVKFGTPLLALVWLSTERPIGPGLLQAALVGALLFAVVVALGLVLLAGPAVGTGLGRLLDRVRFAGHGWPDRLDGLRRDTLTLLRTRWLSLTWWTVAGHANLYILFVLCLRAVGVESRELSWAAILAAFAFGRLITAVPLSPGGLGVMEVGLTGALAAVGRADEASVVAGVLLFRFLTLIVPIALGAVGWVVWTGRGGSIRPAARTTGSPVPPPSP
ncbi:MAG: YbhN family protein [Acidimicrobiales bacterium]